MKLRSLLVALAVASTSAVAAHAQAAFYLNPVAERVSNSKIDNGVYSLLGPNTTSRVFYGVTFGGYYDVPLQGRPFAAGVDVRDSLVHANNASLNSFLVGLRLSGAATPRLRPYIEPFAGVGTSRASTATVHVSKGQYGVFAGADFYLGHHVSWRVAEIGYSSVSTSSSETIGGTASIPSATVLSFTTGLTFRIH